VALARAIGSNTLATAIARFSVLLVWLWTTPTILASLGAERFGLWSILFVVTQVLASLDFGIGAAVSRFLGELSGRGSAGRAPRLIAQAVALQALLVLVLAVPTFLLRDRILGFFPVDPAWRAEARDAFALALLAFAFGALANLMVACLQGLQRMELAVRIFVPAAVLLFAGIHLAMRDPLPLRALTAVQALYALLILLATAVAVVVAARAEGPHPADADAEAARRAITWRDLVRLGSWIQVTTLFGLVQNHVDKVLLGRLVSLEPVGAFEIAARVTNVLFLPATFFLGAFLPALARHEAGRDGLPAPESRRAVYRIAFVPYGIFVVGTSGALVALAPALLESWLGTPPALATFMLRMVTVAAAFNLVTGIASTVLRAGDRARVESLYAAGMVSLHVALSVVGFRLFGTPGILLGAVVSSFLGGLWLNHRVEAWLGAPPLAESAAALAPPLVAATLATLVTVLLDGALSGGEPGRMRGLVRLAAGSAVYAGAFLLVLGGLFPARWNEFRAQLGRVVAGAADAV
jgi:O-antigen/teichoic acid export membrane protein